MRLVLFMSILMGPQDLMFLAPSLADLEGAGLSTVQAHHVWVQLLATGAEAIVDPAVLEMDAKDWLTTVGAAGCAETLREVPSRATRMPACGAAECDCHTVDGGDSGRSRFPRSHRGGPVRSRPGGRGGQGALVAPRIARGRLLRAGGCRRGRVVRAGARQSEGGASAGPSVSTSAD